MSQRTLAGVLALPLLLALWVAALWVPLPYVTYQPGLTVDVLGEERAQEIIQVTGHRTYRDDGELRMTTVYVTQPGARVNLLEVMGAWLSDEEAVYPYDAVYAPDETAEDADLESAVEMVSSQDEAVAVALRELGYQTTPVVKIQNVTKGMPADGGLKVGDVLASVGGTRVEKPEDVARLVQRSTPGRPLEFGIERDGEELTVSITPEEVDGMPRVGIVPGPGYTFPFTVHVNIDADIGGPSAGLMLSLAIYDTLTPGSLTGDAVVAGTGTLDDQGAVGPIGGIQQKIVGARDAGAALFMVPPGNCDDALGAPNGDMRLVRAETMNDAVRAIEAWVDDHDAPLPACTASASGAEGSDA
jgi:PDZ domain-containing protein